jgi:glyoxylase-like metal-dependent hydrolase (beta-lactamase superfamily II)/rhodanese-related sulfurtransferase
MIVEQLYTKCLSEAAYFIADGGEAAVVDPLRDVEEYIEKAEALGVKLKYIFETHFHADFVSGHRELAARTGAEIVYGPGARPAFPIHSATDGEVFKIGNVEMKALHTPGHTLESTCYLLSDAAGAPYSVFTGDTLFVGDVGRPDLAAGSSASQEELAGMLYDSLHKHITSLPDSVIVYPAHGAGSACGKALGKETFSTVGEQKAANYALQAKSRDVFIEEVTEGLAPPPVYFPINVALNKGGAASLEDVMSSANRALSIGAFKAAVEAGAWIVDTRDSTVFTQGFVPGSVSIGLDGRYAEWAGSLLPFDQNLVLVTAVGKEEESITRLARVGLDKGVGYLNGGYEAWAAAGEEVDMIIDIEPDEFMMDLPHDPNLEVLDVRKPGEFDAGHVTGSANVPLDTLIDPLVVAEVPDERNLYVLCGGGYRSVIAASLLKRQGIHNLRNVMGGWGALKDVKGLPVETA